MPTLNQLAEWVRVELGKGKGGLHTNHVVIIEDENAKKAENPPNEEGKRKTRIVWEAGDPDVFAEFHSVREIYMKAAGGNPVLGTEAMLVALKMHKFEAIREFIEAITTVKAGQP